MHYPNRYRVGVAAGVVALAAMVGACRGEDNRADRAASEAGNRAEGAASEAQNTIGNSWITTKIQAKYFADGDVKGRNIDVTTRDGVVTLDGNVQSEQARQRAVQIARETEGVQRVVDNLTVGEGAQASAAQPSETSGTTGQEGETGTQAAASGGQQPGQQSKSQPDVLTRVRAQFFSRPSIRHSDITVSASGGVVTLAGQARSDALRQQAVSIARATPGVQRVEDNIEVNQAGAEATSGEVSAVPRATETEEPAPGEEKPVPAPEARPAPEGEEMRPAPEARPTPEGEETKPAPEGEEARPAPAPEGGEAAPAPGTEPSDEWIETQIQAQFFKDPLIKNASITVRASEGKVTLDGQVPSQDAHKRALELARQTKGVKDVVDGLTIGR